MNFRNVFAYLLSAIVILITLMSLLAIWDIVQWEYVQAYFGKTVRSLIVISISAVVIYLIQSLLFKKETEPRTEQKSAQ
ncbi:MAG: hypothetical protein K1X54_02790 [Flavobacteriales bacterium]|nr:hypothetical protein [Flavobacteriales bacterium]